MDTILDRLGQVSSHDFIGCMQTVTINDVELLGETSLSDAGIERACPRSEAGDVCAGYTCANGGACVSEWTGAVCHCTPGFMGTHCEEALKPIGFSPATYISIKMRETARRDALLVDGSRRRRATTSSSLMLRFRTTQTNGMLMFASAEGNRFCVLSVFDGSVKFTVTQYGGSKSVITPNINVSDGEWHNVTVSLNGGAPSTVTIDNQNFKDFQGCISVFKLDGEQLPMIGETEKYKIVATAGYENGCSDMCTNNVCNGNGCTIEGEAIVCAQPPGGGPALSIGIIIMIVFFVVLLIVIVIVFIVFRKRGQQCLKRKQLSAGAPAKSANSSGHSNPDSGYGENNIDELIIRNHVAQELAHSNYSRQLNGHLVKPDIIKSEVNRTAMPLEMEDGTVIIDNASDVTHLRDLNGEVLEHYDIENASSIAPSDIDVVDHYRHFHDGKQRRKNKAHSDHSQSKHSSRHYNNNSNHSNHSYHSHGMRDSPNLVSSVPFMNDLARNSPSARHSPMMNQLSRNSPNVQPSPLTVNIHGHHMPVTDLNGGSRTTSEHSLASHRSKTSNSTPNKPKRQMLPNGNLNSNKVLNHNYENGKFLTKEEVDRLNARPRESPASLMEAFSTSSENNTRKMQKPFEQYQDTSVLLEPPDSSSDDSANDSFTCSEFEYENDKPRNDFDPTNRIFSKIKEETEHEDGAYHNKNFKVDGLDSGGNSFSSNERSSDDNQGQSKAINSAFNWDDLLNWGPKFEKLVGVFTDIALLPDAENVDFAEAEAKSVDREEYV
ncbi:FAT-like protein [Mya arenaria]|uniref:FAT-like protein n=1 Tax=Mya arenaria TaxID=6604 RepID=A0ABY7DPQ0_MYAAR|nr:FAT-like protein [Mya arenaria]